MKTQIDSSNISVVAQSPSFKQAIELAKKASSCQSHVLITGESGTGKEVIAKLLHQLGSHRQEPFVAVNCSAIPENLLESELFGHAKGSFTGASERKIGLFEEAQAGTLFLDEIGDMSLSLQAKILRVLQDRKIRRVGENQEKEIRARVVAATHKDLRSEVLEKRFREDLFFRLNVIPIHLSPLRERKEDIAPLAEFFLQKHAVANGFNAKTFSAEALTALLSKNWFGNARELENTIERAVVLSSGNVIEKEDLIDIEEPLQSSRDLFGEVLKFEQVMKLEDITQAYILKVLEKNNGAKEKTAKELGIDRKTLYRKLTDQMPISASSRETSPMV